MKYIRIKVKSLILLTILLVGISLFANDIYWFGVKTYNNIASDDYKLNIDEMTTHTLRNEANRLELMLTENHYSLYQLTRFGDGMMTGGSRISSKDALKVLDQFYVFDGDNDLYKDEIDYVLNVILTQWFGGNVEEAKTLLASMTFENMSEKQMSEYYVIKSAIDLSEINLASFEDNRSKITYEDYLPIKNALGQFVERFYEGNFNNSITVIKYDEVDNNKYLSYFRDLFYLLSYSEEPYDFNKEKQVINHKISGYVTLNGQPVQGVFVYPKYYSGMSSNEGFDKNICVTDENGYYELKNPTINLRDINIAVPWQRFHRMQILRERNRDYNDPNKHENNFEFFDGVKFSKFEIHDGILDYAIEDLNHSSDRSYFIAAEPLNGPKANGYTSITYKITSDALEGQVAIDTLRNYTDMPFSYSSSKDQLAVERFMEPLYLSGDYKFRININVADRNAYVWNGLSTDSLSTIAWVDGEDSYNQGDLLLEARKVEEAKAWYLENPSLHNLRVLIALYTRGSTVVEGEHYQTLTGSEPNKAIPLLEDLIKEYGKTQGRVSDLARLYKEQGDYESEENVLKSNISEASSVYEHFTLAYNDFNQGRYTEGTDRLLEYGDMAVDGDRYYSYFIIGNRIEPLPDKIKEELMALNVTEDFEDFFQLIREGQTEAAYDLLLSMEESELKEFYMLNLIESFSTTSWNDKAYSLISFDTYKASMGLEEDITFYDYYRSVYDETSNMSLRKLYQIIKKGSGWLDH